MDRRGDSKMANASGCNPEGAGSTPARPSNPLTAEERAREFDPTRFKQMVDEIDRLKADKERLEDLLDSNVSSLGKQLADTGRERNRYREALEEAKSLALSNSKSWIGTTNGFLKIARLAHTALKGEDG